MKVIITRTGEREFRVERMFDAPRRMVWRAMTDPKLLAKWWGRGNALDVERYEVVRGGHWRFVEHAEHGSFGFEGRFGEVDPEKRTVMTFEWDGMPAHVSLNTATYEDTADGKTRFVSTSLFFTKEDCDGMLQSGMEDGMNASYAALDTVLKSL